MSTELSSERVVVSAPMSLHGSAARIWRPLVVERARATEHTGAKVGWYALALTLIALAWTLVLSWYLIFGLLVIPYRLIRRGQRKRRLEEMRHREVLEAQRRQLEAGSAPPLATTEQERSP